MQKKIAFFQIKNVIFATMMKTAIVQHAIRWNESQWNLQHLDALLAKAPKADLYVLAETFSTGFMPEIIVNAASPSSFNTICPISIFAPFPKSGSFR